jgi:G3E family GTPase
LGHGASWSNFRSTSPGRRLIPTTVIGGYLGAGKTTLVNHLLRHANGKRIAVLVNDFGDINIDADLIQARSQDVIQLTGGCVCCSFGSDFMGTLLEVAARVPAPEHILIEASGVGLPLPIAASASLVAQVCVAGIVVMVDASSLAQQSANRYVGDTVTNQLHQADVLVLNKLDLVERSEQTKIRCLLERLAPNAVVINSVQAQLTPSIVFGEDQGPRTPQTRKLRSRAPMQRHLRPNRAAQQVFVTRRLALNEECDVAALGQALAGAELGIVRAKGFSFGGAALMQLTGKRVNVTATAAMTNSPKKNSGLIVCIAIASQFNASQFAALAEANGARVAA